MNLGLVERPPCGYQLSLSFDDERGDDAVVPSALTDGVTTATDLLLDALQPIVGDTGYNPNRLAGTAFFGDPSPDQLIETDPSLAPWVWIAVALVGPDEHPPAEMVWFGVESSQASLSVSPVEISS